MAFQTILPKALAARGLTVETVPGWETRGSSAFSPGGAVCHWTAGPAGSTTRPSLNVVVNGRSDLAGPLCNVFLDRNGVAVVVAAGRANHAGTGSWRGLTGNSAVFGTECEAAGADDFTEAQRIAYPKVNAAYADISKFAAGMVCGHSEWAPDRKIDINGYPMTTMRADVATLLAGGSLQEDDMTPEQAQTLDKILYAITDLIKPQTDRITAVQSDVAEVHWGLLDPAQGLRVMVAGLLGKEASGVTAADIAGLIPNGIAADVADELQRRLTA